MTPTKLPTPLPTPTVWLAVFYRGDAPAPSA